MSAARTLVLAADPVAAWRQAPSSAPFEAVFVASPAARAAFGLAGDVATTTLERWARRPPLVVIAPLARRRALVEAVADVLGREDAAGFAAVAGDAVRDLLQATDPGSEPPVDIDGRTRRWWDVAQRYRARLAELGGCDPAETRRRAAQRLRADPATRRQRLAVLGHTAFAADEVALIDALAAPGSLVVLPHDPPWTDAHRDAVDDLVGRGWTVRHEADGAPFAPLVAHAWPTMEDEARGALAEVKRLRAAGVAADEVVLVARDVAAYAEAVAAAADEVGLPVRVDRWLPLARTPPAAPVMAWLEAVAQRGAFEPTLAWLAHPAVGRLDADDVARVRRWRPGDDRAWARAAGADVQRALAWPRDASAARWRERLAGGWGRLGPSEVAGAGGSAAELPDAYVDGPATPPVAGAPAGVAGVAVTPPAAAGHEPAPAAPWRDVAVQAAWTAALEGLDASADASGRVSRATVLGALRDAMRHTTVRLDDTSAPPGDPSVDDGEVPDVDLAAAGRPLADGAGAAAPVWLRPLEALGDARVPHVLLLGAVDGVLPKAVPDDPILGFRERSLLVAAGVPVTTAGRAGRLEALRFWGARRAATERLWVGVPAQTGADARLPSPFLARLGVEPGPPPPAPPASPQAFRAAALRATDVVPDAAEPVLARARQAYAQALRRETGSTWGPDDGFVGVAADRKAWSATGLRVLGTCRFRWWASSELGVGAPEEGPEELTPLLQGRLYHAALEVALAPAVGLVGAAARAAARAALPAAFAAAEARESVAEVVPHWPRLRAEHLAHLDALLEAPDFLADDHEVVSLEGRFEGEWHGWNVRGRVDRIDRTPNGVELIDYKLSGRKPVGARDAELKLTVDLQLPLYVDVAAPALAPGEAVATASYLSLRTRERVRAAPPNADDLADLLTRLRASLAAGFFPPEPDDDVCRFCDLAAVCRKGPHLARRPPPYRVPPPVDS